jgi:prepilin-type N-terminal cleavage/methylation domain-containing protein
VRHSRRGFTLIELVIVIGIIMILMGLLVVGYRHINATAARRESVAELHVMRGMLQDYENHAGLAGIEFAAAQANDTNAPSPGKFPVFIDPASTVIPGSKVQWPIVRAPLTGSNGAPSDSTDISADGVPAQSSGAGDLYITINGVVVTDMGDKADTGGPRYVSGAVLRTYDVMYVLMHLPSNRTTAQAIQSKRLLEPPSGSAPSTIDKGVVLLDGWGNPIIFVPRGGIHVYIQNPASTTTTPLPPNIYLVRSTGTTLVTPSGTLIPDPPMTGAERPFFASAGQDGDFTQGEDNIYSFQD